METPRMILRQRTRVFLEKVKKESIEGQMEDLGVHTMEELELELTRIDRLLQLNEDEWVLWDLIDKTSNQIIGNGGFHNYKAIHRRAELGYWISEDYRRKGLMTEAVNRMIQYGFEEMDLNRIEAHLSPSNIPSKKLVETLNFTQEGLLKEHYIHNNVIYDSFVYALLKSEYEGV